MKKRIYILLSVVILSVMTGCTTASVTSDRVNDQTYPEDYPEEGSYIKVAGVFDTYEDGEYIYCTLRNAVLE